MSGASASGASSAAAASSTGSSSPSFSLTAASSAGASHSSSQGGFQAATSAASVDLSQESLSQRSFLEGTPEGARRGAEALDAFSTLSVPARPSLVAQDAALAQEISSAQQASKGSRQGLTVAVEAESRGERPALTKSSRSGAALAEANHQGTEASHSQEKTVAAEGRSAKSAALSTDLEGESFSARLSSWRGDSQKPPVESSADQERKREEPTEKVDEEELLTQYYRKVLEGLVASKMISEEMASVARGKRGRDLVAAVGEVLSKAEEQKQEIRARRDEAARDPFSAYSAQASDNAARQRSNTSLAA